MSTEYDVKKHPVRDFFVTVAFFGAIALFVLYCYRSAKNDDDVYAKVMAENFEVVQGAAPSPDILFRGVKVDVSTMRMGSRRTARWRSFAYFTPHLNLGPECEFKIVLDGLVMTPSLPKDDRKALETMEGFFGSDDMRRLLVRPGVFDALRQLEDIGPDFSVGMDKTGQLVVETGGNAKESEERLKKLIGAGMVIFRQAIILAGEMKPELTRSKKFSRIQPAAEDFIPAGIDLKALGFHPDSVADLPISPNVPRADRAPDISSPAH